MYNDPNQPYQQDPNQSGQPPYSPFPGQANQSPFNPQPNFGANYDPNQPYFAQPSQPSQPPKKNVFAWYKRQKNGTKLGVGCLSILGLLLLCGMCSGIANIAAGTNKPTQTSVSPTATSKQITQKQLVPTPKPTATPRPKPTPKPKPKPTATPTPKLTSAQVEAQYKSGTTDTTVTTVDKDGNADQYKNLHFTCIIGGFVKDDSGNTAGANVTDPDTMKIIQVAFTPGTDISQLNEGDTLEVWGLDAGVSSGTNAFGATITEAAVQALYLTDQTTGYEAHS
jgi:hypothetical protein